jgi:hypothetical protein
MYKKLFKENSLSILKDENIIQEIFDFIYNNPYPTDDDFHAFAESKDIKPDVIETYVYAILSCFIVGGNYNKKKVDNKTFDQKEVNMGKIVENEHVDADNKNIVVKKIVDLIRTRISWDHLADNDKYYTQAKEGKLQIEELKK